MVLKVEHSLEIPIGWEMKSLKDLSSLITKGTSPSSVGYSFVDEGINFIKVESVSKNNNIIPEQLAKITKDCHKRLNRSIILEHDLLMSIAGTLGRLGIVEKEYLPANTNQALSIIRLKDKSNVKYIYYALQLNSVKKEINNIATTGAQPNLSLKQVGDFQVLLPPLNERNIIVDILSKSDEQIEKTEQLIEKTIELKKGLMQQLLTKGIGHSEFKKTEIGEIPVDWKIKSFVELMEPGSEGVKRGPFGGALKKDIFVEDGYAVYEQQHAIYKNFHKIRYFIDDIKFVELKAFELKANDLIISCSGTIGKIAIVPDGIKQGVMNQALLRFRALKNKVDTLFLFYLLTSEETQKKMLDMTHGSTIKNMIAVSEIKKIKVPLPSYEEQQRISDILSSVDNQINIYEKEKEKQVELKKALMQQLLTGKLRVTV